MGFFSQTSSQKLSAGVTTTLMSKPAAFSCSAKTWAMRTMPGTPSAV